MKNIGCIMRLFVVGYLLFQANCVNSAELTKIKIGEKVNVDFLHHKDLSCKKSEFELYSISIHSCYLSKDTFTCYLTYPLSNDGVLNYKKNEFKWNGAMLAIPKKGSKYGRLFPRGGNCPAMEKKRDGKISILKYKNNAWIKVGETWTDGGNWEGPCMEDADKILSKIMGIRLRLNVFL